MSKPRKKESFIKQYLKAVRFYLLTGLMVWTPLLVTVWLTWWLFSNVGLGIESVIENIYARLIELGGKHEKLKFLTNIKYEKGYGFLITIALFLTTGFIARNLVGIRIIRSIERMFSRIPGVNRIYKAVGQIRDVVAGRQGALFQQVCIVEYPRPGVFVVAFVTSKDRGIVQESLDKNLVAVFVPTTPNPTSGFLLYLESDQVREIDLEVEEAMKLIVSGGAYIPGKDTDELLPDGF